MNKLKKIIVAALLLATTIVLNRFISIKTPILVISFSGLPIMLCAILLGPCWTMLVAGLADLIGALLFPFGAYFVGYTISAALAGLIYGLFLYRNKKQSKKIFIFKLVLSTILVLTICNGILNTLWIYITTKKALFAILPTRIIKQLIMLPILDVSIFFIDLGLEKMGIYKNLKENDEEFTENIVKKEENLENNLKTTENLNSKKENINEIKEQNLKQNKIEQNRGKDDNNK